MKNLLITTAMAAACVTPLAHAQASNFAGLGIGVGVVGADTTTEDITTLSRSATSSDSNAMLQLQYNLAVNDMFLVGFGGSASLGDLKAGTFGTTQLKLRDAYSLYVAPGYAFNNSWMGYGKLAYLNANVQSSNGKNASFDSGYGVGIGLQALFGKNWFGQAEYMFNQYDNRSVGPGETLKLKSNIYSLTAGYRF